jgi:hypothetical protein
LTWLLLIDYCSAGLEGPYDEADKPKWMRQKKSHTVPLWRLLVEGKTSGIISPPRGAPQVNRIGVQQRPNFLKSPRHCDVCMRRRRETHSQEETVAQSKKECSGTRKGCPIVPSQCVSVVGLLLAMTNAVLGLRQSLEKRRLKKRVLLYVLIEFSSLSNKIFCNANNFL